MMRSGPWTIVVDRGTALICIPQQDVVVTAIAFTTAFFTLTNKNGKHEVQIECKTESPKAFDATHLVLTLFEAIVVGSSLAVKK